MKKRIVSLILCLAALLTGIVACAPSVGSDPNGDSQTEQNQNNQQEEEVTMKLGLYTQDGILYQNGKPFYRMGVNYYSLFNSSFPKSKDEIFDVSLAYHGLQVLAENKIPFIRTNLGNYYWHEMPVYFERREETHKAILSIVREAERLNIGILPSFYWSVQCVSDYYREPMRAWGDKNSKTRAFMRAYTEDMVNLLKDSPAIWGWEFGNEFNLGADLPNAAENRPPLFDGSARPAEDCISLSDIHDAMGEFSEIVTRLDLQNRMITSGNAVLRPGQYCIYKNGNWGMDTEEEHKTVTELFHPKEVDVISEHIYFRKDTYFGRELNLDEYLKHTMQMCKEIGKPLLVGEFGHNNNTEPEPTEELREDAYQSIALSMVNNGVQASLIWNYDPLNQTEYSFSENGRKGAFLFDLIRKCNEEFDSRY